MEKHNTNEATRRLVKVLVAPDEMGRPFFGPPGVPADRVKILREGFMKMMQDPDALATAKKQNLEVGPTPGDQLEAVIKEIGNQSPEVIQRMKKLLE